MMGTDFAPMLLVGAAGLGVVFLLFFLNRPDLGLLSVLFLRAFTDLSLGGLHQRTAGTVVTSPNIGLLLILIFAGGLFVFTRHVRLLSLPAAIPFVLLLLTGLIGMLRSENHLFSLDQWLRATSSLVVYALAAHLFQTSARIQKVVDILAVSFIIPALFGLYQLVTGRAYNVEELGITRVTGTFVHPNAFGMFLVIFFGIFLCQAIVQSGTRRVIALGIVATSCVLVAATYARASWAGVVIVLLVVGFLSKRALVFVSLAVLLAVSTIPTIANRMTNPFGERSSFADRQDIWQKTLPQWLEATQNDESDFATVLNRLAGTGPGSVDFLTFRARGAAYAAHDDYLLVLFEYGVLGLMEFVAMSFGLVIFAYRTWRASPTRMMGAVPLSFLAVAIAFLVMSVTDNLFAGTQNQIYFWTLAGLTASIGRNIAVESRQTMPAQLEPAGS